MLKGGEKNLKYNYDKKKTIRLKDPLILEIKRTHSERKDKREVLGLRTTHGLITMSSTLKILRFAIIDKGNYRIRKPF